MVFREEKNEEGKGGNYLEKKRFFCGEKQRGEIFLEGETVADLENIEGSIGGHSGPKNDI